MHTYIYSTQSLTGCEQIRAYEIASSSDDDTNLLAPLRSQKQMTQVQIPMVVVLLVFVHVVHM